MTCDWLNRFGIFFCIFVFSYEVSCCVWTIQNSRKSQFLIWLNTHSKIILLSHFSSSRSPSLPVSVFIHSFWSFYTFRHYLQIFENYQFLSWFLKHFNHTCTSFATPLSVKTFDDTHNHTISRNTLCLCYECGSRVHGHSFFG